MHFGSRQIHLDIVAGVSQREVTEHFPALMQQKEAHLEALTDFFDEHLHSKFPMADYTFDVYITSHGKVQILSA